MSEALPPERSKLFRRRPGLVSWLIASAVQAGVSALVAVVPVGEGLAGPFFRLAPPLLGGFLFGRWIPRPEWFRRLVGGALVGGLSTLAGSLVALPLGGLGLGAEVVVVSAAGAGLVAGLIGAGLGGLIPGGRQ
ncbi:MAG: hypothetical protein ACT4PM_02945 [Gemmatimonadales bacterium]